MVKDNSKDYPEFAGDRNALEEQFQLFPARVVSVDYERKSIVVQDERSNLFYPEVRLFPASASDVEGSDVSMAVEGATCLCAHIHYRRGFSQVAIINWVLGDANLGQDAIATKAFNGVEGWNQRKRSLYRKAYPGQRTVTNKEGYTEKVDDGWDKTAADLSREQLNPHRRTFSRTTSRQVKYTDAGLTFEGPINRVDADGLTPRTLPDGSKEHVVYLQPNASLEDRYNAGKPDIIALVERLQRTQEFALDFPLPLEILDSIHLDTVLGTAADPWERTSVTTTGKVSHDDQSFLIDQDSDHPAPMGDDKILGPTLSEGPTPRRRAFIKESSEGTLVGYNRFDKTTYGKILKPVLFPNNKVGRFAADVESSYLPVDDSKDHVETRLAASASATRYPHEYNTTRYDVTKEGLVSFEVGSTIPKENIPLEGDYEHPHGAGRSVEGHLLGSLKMVVGKNRDEEESIDLQALGQVVLRLGADDSSLPDARRSVMTQMRGKSDSVLKRALQFWKKSKLQPGDAGDLENKTGAENVSLRAATDGGVVMRFGARNSTAKRRHLINGYKEGKGITAWGVSDSGRIDSKTSGRPTYGSGDSTYAFHDLTKAGQAQIGFLPYGWSGAPVEDMDKAGLSIDFHTVRDVLLRFGQNTDSGQSLLLDLAGGLAAWFGKDKKGRSVTATLDGGVELVIGQNNEKKSLRIEFNGDVDWLVKGNFHLHVTGDTVFESTTHRHNAKTDYIVTAQKIIEVGLTRHTREAPDIVDNQGLYESEENE